MADEIYAKKLEALQQYIPFLENMITQLKDPKKKNREQQLTKMESLYAMITDKKKKLKLDTLVKCEDVLIKLYSKVKPIDKPVQHEGQKFVCKAPPDEPKAFLDKNREEKLKFEAARARLHEYATPDSPPSHNQDFVPTKPVLIPTEKVPAMKVPNPNEFQIRNWEDTFGNTSAVERPSIYSSAVVAGKSAHKITPLDEIATLTDLSKPPISAEDLELLKEDDATDDLSLTELESIRDKIQKKLNVNDDKEKKKDKKHHQKHSKSSEESAEKSAKAQKDLGEISKPKSPRVEKVIKESDSIFGTLLSSIDDRILGDKKKDKRKDEKKPSESNKKSEHKKTDKSSKDTKKDKTDTLSPKEKDKKHKVTEKKPLESSKTKETKGGESEKKSEKSVEQNKEGDAKQPSEPPVYKRLADKYNPKPRKSSTETEVTQKVVHSIEKDIEKEKTIPLLGSTFAERTATATPAQTRPSLLTQPKMLDPRIKQQGILQPPPFFDNPQPAMPNSNVLDSVLQQIHGTLGSLRANNAAAQHFQPSTNQFAQQQPFATPYNQMVPPSPVANFGGQQQVAPRDQFSSGQNPMFANQQNRNNTFVNTFIVQHNSMNQNQFGPAMNNIQNSCLNVYPQQQQQQQQKKSFNPYDPISPQTQSTGDEYDLSKIQPVDFYSNIPAKKPLLSPPIANYGSAGGAALLPNPSVRPSGLNQRPYQQQRFQKEDHGRTNEFGDRDDRPMYNQGRRRDDRDPRNRQHSSRDPRRSSSDYSSSRGSSTKYDSVYSKLSDRRRSRDREREDSFASPLDSLYSTSGESSKSGKGYGMQKFKIPKIRREEERASTSQEREDAELNVPKNIEVETPEEKQPPRIEKEPPPIEKEKDPEPVAIKEKPAAVQEEEKKASPSEQSMLGEFIAKLITGADKKDVLMSLFNTLAGSLSNDQKKNFRRIRIADDSDSSGDEADKKAAPENNAEAVKDKEEEKSTPEPEEKKDAVAATVTAKDATVEPEESEPVEEEKPEEEEEVEEQIKAPVKGKKKKTAAKGKKKTVAKKAAASVEKPKDEDPLNPESIQDVFESVGERIKSRKRNINKETAKGGRKTELDMLHEDLKDMFIRDGVLTATGKRMCKFLKPNSETAPNTSSSSKKEETSSEDGSPVMARKKTPAKELVGSDDEEDTPLASRKKIKHEPQKEKDIKRKLRGSNPCVLLEKSDFSKLVAAKAEIEETVTVKKTPVKKGKKRKAPTDTESLTSDTSIDISKKVCVLPKRDSLRRSAKMQLQYKDEPSDEETTAQQASDADEDDVEEPSKEDVAMPKKRGKKPKSNWSKGVIKKKRSKSATKSDRSSEASTPVPQEMDIDVGSEPEDHVPVENVTERKASVRVEPDKSYYIQWNSRYKLSCKLCDFKGRNIINHYRVNHPDDEVFISRLSPERAEEVIKDALATDYSSVKPVDLWECKNRRKKFNFECVFCDAVLNDNTESFYDHLTSHTGEFRFHCSTCQYKTNSVKSLRTHLINIHCFNNTNITSQAAYPAPPNYNVVIGYICTECNYIQMMKNSVEQHAKTYHPGKNVVRAISMSNKIKPKAEKCQTEAAVDSVPVKQVKAEKEDVAEISATFIKQEPMEETEQAAQKQLEVEKPKEKEKDMHVFMCKTDHNEENEKIEAERKKKMEEVNLKVKQSRGLNFVDKLKSRLDRQQSIPEEEVSQASDADDGVSATTQPSTVAPTKKQTASTVATPPGARVDAEATFVPKNNAPIGNTIQRLQDTLTSKPPPMMSINEMLQYTVVPSKEDVVLFNGDFSIRRKENGDIMYCCSMPVCIMNTSDQTAFKKHCVTAHSKFSGHTICTLCVAEPPIFKTISACFDHVVGEHWEELMNTIGKREDENEMEKQSQSQPLLRMRRLSGDLLSEMRDTVQEQEGTKTAMEDGMITRDESSGFPFTIASVTTQAEEEPHNFPFAISNVVSLAPEDDSDASAVTLSSTDSPVRNTRQLSTGPPPLSPLIISPGAVPALHIANVQNIAAENSFVRLEPTTASTSKANTSPKMVVQKVTKSPQRIILKDHPMPALEDNESRKELSALKEMLQCYNIVNLYKCPQYTCAFSTNSRLKFIAHLDTHPEMKLMLSRCVYCNFGNRVEHIAVHIDVRHGSSLFLCPYCLYRAVCQSYVQVHESEHHKDQAMVVYKVPRNPESQSARAGLPRPSLKSLFADFLYVCGVPSCRKKMLLREELMNHLKSHVGQAPLSCPLCPQVVHPGMDRWQKINNYIDHLTKHGIGKYLCRYCKMGSDSYNDLHFHMASAHPGLPLEIVARQYSKKMEAQQKFSVDDERLYENLIHLVHEPTYAVNSSLLINLATKRPVSKQDDPVSEPDPVVGESSVAMECADVSPYDEPLVNISQESESNLVDPLSLDEETCNVTLSETQPGFSLASITINEESDSLDTDFDMSTDEAIGGSDDKEGYTGHQLFRCAKCKIGSPSSTSFRSHLTRCVDATKSTKPFHCVHCDKMFKSTSSLIDHIKVHGTVKFGCSLCDFKHGHHLQVRNHMKVRHKVSSVIVTALDPKKTDMDKDEFILRPKLKRRSTGEAPGPISKEDVEENKSEPKTAKTTYSPAEIDLLPRQAIYSAMLKCSVCNYATKVRTNLVRHLEFHSLEKDVPTTAPVNPVPCLEKNEKMFDKMTNLALSSFAGSSRMGGKTEKSEKSGLTKEEEAQLPAFVPITKRYVCGASGCSYLCLEESRLRHHLMALHADDTVYTCRHCDDVLPTEKCLNVDLAMKHLKFHDLHLYKCSCCSFVHNLRHKVERHVSEKHAEKAAQVVVVRELEAESESGVSNVQAEYRDKETKLWSCCMCKYRSATREEIVTHAENKHDIGEQFKCALCTYKSATKDTFDSHFAERHPGHDVDVIDVFYKRDESEIKSKETEPFDTTPLWQRDKQRVRHIRGILFDESGKLPKKSPMKIPPVPTKDNLDRSIDAVATGDAHVLKQKKKNEIVASKFISVLKKRINSDSSVAPAAKRSNASTEKASSNETTVTTSSESKEDSAVIILDDEDTDCVIEKTKPSAVVILDGPDSESSKSKDVSNEIEDAVDPLEIEDASQMMSGNQQTSELMGTFGPFGEPFNNKYLCPLCAKFKTRNAEAVKFHLYEELQYPRYKCKVCGKTAIDYKFFRRHFNRKHNGEFDPAKIEKFPTDRQIELWVENVLKVQGKLIQEEKDRLEALEVNVIEEDDPTAVIEEEPAIMEEQTSIAEVEEQVSSSSSSTPSAANNGSPKKKHACPHCDYSSKTLSDLKKHEKRHWLHKPLKCGYCEFTGVTNSEITTHCRHRHRNYEVRIICVPTPSTPTILPISKRKGKAASTTAEETVAPSITDEELDIVNITSDEERQEDSEDPEEAGPSTSSMFLDMKQYMCNICGHKSDSFVAISRDHLKSHFKPFVCDHCNRRFNYACQVNAHHAKMHQDLEYKCTVLQQEKEEADKLHIHLKQLGEDGNYGSLSKTRRKNPTASVANLQNKRKAESVDENNLLVVQKTVYTGRKKTATPSATKQTARKSTTKQCDARDEGFSSYNQKPDYGDSKKIMTTIAVNNATMTMSIEQLSHIFDLYPDVKVVDCMNKDNPENI